MCLPGSVVQRWGWEVSPSPGCVPVPLDPDFPEPLPGPLCWPPAVRDHAPLATCSDSWPRTSRHRGWEPASVLAEEAFSHGIYSVSPAAVSVADSVVD